MISKKIYLKDYCVPDYLIPQVHLKFDVVSNHKMIVSNTMTIRPNPDAQGNNALCLNGDGSFLSLDTVSVNDVPIDTYDLTENSLTLGRYSTEITVKIVTSFDPSKNLALEGIYMSDGILCSQNEPEGFRRITYFIDRPDVMSRYQVTIKADYSTYPILLSNGNKIDSGDLDRLDRFEGEDYQRIDVLAEISAQPWPVQIYHASAHLLAAERWDFRHWYQNELEQFLSRDFDLDGVRKP